MIKTTLKIDGMMCGMCEAHIRETIRKSVPSAKKLAVSRKRKEASFLSADPVDPNFLKMAINRTGYVCKKATSEYYEEKGWFK